MLQDDDNIEDFSHEVSVPFNADYAIMEANAWRICRRTFATDNLTAIIGTEQLTATPNRSGNVKWICKIRAERRLSNDDD